MENKIELTQYGRPIAPFYLNDIVCRDCGELAQNMIFGRVGPPLRFKNWNDVRDGFHTDFKIRWSTVKGDIEEIYSRESASTSDEFKIRIVDRELKLGSKVCCNGLSGKVVKTHKVASVQSIPGKDDNIIWEVSADKLIPLERAFPGRHILYQNWIGFITEVEPEMFLKTDDGKICSIPIKLVGESSDRFWHGSFYLPGQSYEFGFLDACRANWMSGSFTWFANLASSFVLGPINTVVLGTKVQSVKVEWMGLCNDKYCPADFPMPPNILTDEMLRLTHIQYVDICPSEHLQTGWIRHYKTSEEDTILTKSEWEQRMLQNYSYNSTFNKSSTTRTAENSNHEIAVKVVFVRNVVTVLWQDGSKSTLYAGEIERFEDPIREAKSHGCPTFVVNKTVDDDSEGFGFVKSYDYNLQTYLVDWFSVEPGNICVFREEREVAKFDAEPHPLFQKLVRKDQIVIKAKDSQLAYFEVGVVCGVHNGQIRVFGSDGEEYFCSPTDLAQFNFISNFDEESMTWKIDKRVSSHSSLLRKRSSSSMLTRIDSAKDLLCESRSSQNILVSSGRLSYLDKAPETHHFFKVSSQVTDFPRFAKAVGKQVKIIEGNLPEGIWVKAYEDRMDLFSVLVEGADQTPYESHLFLFDVQLPPDFPQIPPRVHFISWSESINPNLYIDGKVCLSLLGTWEGQESEIWNAKSTLLQILVSIQGLILVAEPFFNEPIHEQIRGTEEGKKKSAEYNAHVLINCLDSCLEMISRPPEPWKSQIAQHYCIAIPNKIKLGLNSILGNSNGPKPKFNILPLSKPFALAIEQRMCRFDELMTLVNAESQIEDENNNN